MSRYTKEQIECADSTDLISYAVSRGYELIQEGADYRIKGHDSLYLKGNKWYWHARQKGGKAVSFLMEYEQKTFLEAMKILLGDNRGKELPVQLPMPEDYRQPKDSKQLKIPIPAATNDDVLKYLTGRGIREDLVRELIDRGLIYQTEMYWKRGPDGDWREQSCVPQVVFLGTCWDGSARYAGVRFCSGDRKYEAPGSDKAYGFHVEEPGSKALWVFESPIDLLSHITLCSYAKKQFPASRIALGGLSPLALIRYLNDYPDIEYVDLGLDADEPGREAARSIQTLIKDRCMVYDHPPRYGKDYNEELQIRQKRFLERKKAGGSPKAGDPLSNQPEKGASE